MLYVFRFNSESCWLALLAFIHRVAWLFLHTIRIALALWATSVFFFSSPSLSLTDFNFNFSILLLLGRPLSRSNDDQKHKRINKYHKFHNCLCAAYSYTHKHIRSCTKHGYFILQYVGRLILNMRCCFNCF